VKSIQRLNGQKVWMKRILLLLTTARSSKPLTVQLKYLYYEFKKTIKPFAQIAAMPRQLFGATLNQIPEDTNVKIVVRPSLPKRKEDQTNISNCLEFGY